MFNTYLVVESISILYLERSRTVPIFISIIANLSPMQNLKITKNKKSLTQFSNQVSNILESHVIHISHFMLETIYLNLRTVPLPGPRSKRKPWTGNYATSILFEKPFWFKHVGFRPVLWVKVYSLIAYCNGCTLDTKKIHYFTKI